MRLRLGLVVILFAALSLDVSSQTPNPCDAGLGTGTQTVILATSTAPFSVGVCQLGVDVNGNPTTVTGIVVQVDGVEKYRGLPANAIGPNAAGQTFYATPKTLTAPLGTHTVTVAAINAGGAGAGFTRPFVLRLPDGVPVAPSGVDVRP